MRPFFFLSLTLSLHLLLGGVAGTLRGAPGDVDLAFDPNVDNGSSFSGVAGFGVQPDGKIIIGGRFTNLQPNGAASATARKFVARLNRDGSLDTTFNPTANNYVPSITLQADGKIILAGDFTTLQPNGAATATTRNRIARLNADGTLDTTFNPNANEYFNCVALQTDGKLVVGGNFTTLQPNGAATPTTRNRIARLNTDGSLDTTFNPNANGVVNSVTLQPDGKIIVCGVFTTLQPNGAASATTRNRIARLNTDGSLDTAFNPNATGGVNCAALQADGKIFIGGSFTALQANGAANATLRNAIARLNSDGSVDPDFYPYTNGQVGSATVQADGKILFSGEFTYVHPAGGLPTDVPRNRFARLNSDGTLDTAFNPGTSSYVYGCAFQADGGVLVGGEFTALASSSGGSVARSHLARLTNDAALQKVLVTGSTTAATVRFLRSGSLPEVPQVTVEASANAGATWTSARTASRITGGWQVTSFALPAATGLIRVRGRVAGGSGNGSSWPLEVIAPYPTPDISVEQPTNTVLASGASTVDFGEVALGASFPKTFTIRNVGPDELRVNFTVDGANAADFVVDTNDTNTTVGAGDNTIFAVNFAPMALPSGSRSATLHVLSNANGTNSPFNVALTGLGLSATTSTGNDGLSDHAKYNLSALGFDWHLSQPTLVQALYGGASTAGLYTTAQVQALNVGTPLIQKDASTGQFKLTISVQQSANLQTFTPLSLTSGGSSMFNAAGALEFRFTSPSGAQFYRLQSK